MDRYEIDRRFEAREPIAGVAYLLGDSVRVPSGPHAGSRGMVASLVATDPRSVYRVELRDGAAIEIEEAGLVTATAGDPGASLTALQRWYSARCDGDGEHGLGVRIETLDNPGWKVDGGMFKDGAGRTCSGRSRRRP